MAGPLAGSIEQGDAVDRAVGRDLDLVAPGLAAAIAQPEDAGLSVGRLVHRVGDRLGLAAWPDALFRLIAPSLDGKGAGKETLQAKTLDAVRGCLEFPTSMVNPLQTLGEKTLDTGATKVSLLLRQARSATMPLPASLLLSSEGSMTWISRPRT
jgi:hypothetical protein